MSQISRTKDERFVIRLYEAALETGDVQHEFDRYEIGRSIGLSEKAVDTICNLLAQANFIKKTGKELLYLTPHGEQLALRLKNPKER